MTALVTVELGPDRLAEVRAGDLLTALNGQLLDDPLTVTAALHTLPGTTIQAISLRTEQGLSANLYPDTAVDLGITIRRPERAVEPPAARSRRPVTRNLDGLRLISEAGSWWTEDRRYEVRRGYGGITVCESPHPVRITPRMAAVAAAESTRLWARQILDTLAAGKRGYLCPGATEHPFDEWEVWDHQLGDYADPQFTAHCETFREAALGLATVLRRRPGRRPTRPTAGGTP